jgi:hypothetical protein
MSRLIDEISPILKIKTVCREFVYRNNIKGRGKTEYILFDTVVYQIVRPSRIERSRTGAHGFDIYCLPEETWKDIAVVRVEESTSGKLSFDIQSSVPLEDLRELLSSTSSFNEMIQRIHTYLHLKRRSR